MGGLAAAALIGICDLVGTALYTQGAAVGLVSVVGAIAATYTLVPVIGGMAFLGERPAPNQLAGIALVVIGLVVMGGS
jgi:drug/metabolite transporter (DMT)-like permease